MVGCSRIVRSIQNIPPIWSVDKNEARHRVVKLYKLWYREIPHIVRDYSLPKSTEQCRAKLCEEFSKHKEIKDIRRIDMLMLNGQKELTEICCMQKDRADILKYWPNDCHEHPKPTEFLEKFLVGKN